MIISFWGTVYTLVALKQSFALANLEQERTGESIKYA